MNRATLKKQFQQQQAARDELLALTGIPLAEAVARHVMGWQLQCSSSEAVKRMGTLWTAPDRKVYLIPYNEIRRRDNSLVAIVARVWEPHKDMRAAWEVFMAAPGDVKALRAPSGGDAGPECLADIDGTAILRNRP